MGPFVSIKSKPFNFFHEFANHYEKQMTKHTNFHYKSCRKKFYQKIKRLASPWINKNGWEISFRKKQKHAILSGTFATKFLEEGFYKNTTLRFPQANIWVGPFVFINSERWFFFRESANHRMKQTKKHTNFRYKSCVFFFSKNTTFGVSMSKINDWDHLFL